MEESLKISTQNEKPTSLGQNEIVFTKINNTLQIHLAAKDDQNLIFSSLSQEDVEVIAARKASDNIISLEFGFEVDNISERDDIPSDKIQRIVFVKDASGDSTVTPGNSAGYWRSSDGGNWVKLFETGSKTEGSVKIVRHGW